MSAPISDGEMAAILRRAVNVIFPAVADVPDGPAFEMTAPATGQRFRVAVTEVAAWSGQVDRELGEVIREGGAT